MTSGAKNDNIPVKGQSIFLFCLSLRKKCKFLTEAQNLLCIFTGIISAVVAYLLGLHHWTRLTLLIYVCPMLARMVNYPPAELHKVHNFASVFICLVIAFYIFNCVPQVCHSFNANTKYKKLLCRSNSISFPLWCTNP